MASGTIQGFPVVYHKLIQTTTTAAGNVVTGLNVFDHIIIGAAINRRISGYYTSFYNLMPCSSDSEGNITITAVSPGSNNTTVLSSTAVAVDVWYIDNNSVDVT